MLTYISLLLSFLLLLEKRRSNILRALLTIFSFLKISSTLIHRKKLRCRIFGLLKERIYCWEFTRYCRFWSWRNILGSTGHRDFALCRMYNSCSFWLINLIDLFLMRVLWWQRNCVFLCVFIWKKEQFIKERQVKSKLLMYVLLPTWVFGFKTTISWTALIFLPVKEEEWGLLLLFLLFSFELSRFEYFLKVKVNKKILIYLANFLNMITKCLTKIILRMKEACELSDDENALKDHLECCLAHSYLLSYD